VRVFRYSCITLLAAMLLVAVSAAYPQSAQQSPLPSDPQPKTDSSTAKNEGTKSADSPGKAPAPATAPRASAAAPKPAATSQPRPANSGGMVWVNTETGVYHKPGSRYYGKTKVGKYMTEADAKKGGYRAAKKQ
jgi:hypothetical protein